jgi:protein-S-isoprenylcysteine O-methyltransferase Ste14
VKLSPSEIIPFVWGAWLVSWLAAAAWSSPIERRAQSESEAGWRLLTAVGALLMFGVHPRWFTFDISVLHPGVTTSWALLAISLGGFAFTWWARIALGRLWSSGVTRKVNHSIVMRGPYRIVRHPVYCGIIIAALATAAMRGMALAYFGALLIVFGLFLKARVEEDFLKSELGPEQYGAYARRVPMLVPFLRL